MHEFADTKRAVDNKSAFIIEADEIIRAALEFMLHDETEAHELATVEEAYAKAKTWKSPDLVLLGLSFVQEKGIGLLKEIKEAFSGCKILLVVENAQDELVKECLKNGADAAMAKPLKLDFVRQKVEVLLGRQVGLAIPLKVF